VSWLDPHLNVWTFFSQIPLLYHNRILAIYLDNSNIHIRAGLCLVFQALSTATITPQTKGPAIVASVYKNRVNEGRIVT